ncbi:MAG: ATP:cob(I)alamin adenosyltransferase, partial [Limisphaera sp.]
PRGWALPGANPLAAALDFARTVCRRAERRVCALTGPDPEPHRQAVMYLNRLSDLLWLWARRMEQPDEARGKGPS